MISIPVEIKAAASAITPTQRSTTTAKSLMEEIFLIILYIMVKSLRVLQKIEEDQG